MEKIEFSLYCCIQSRLFCLLVLFNAPRRLTEEIQQAERMEQIEHMGGGIRGMKKMEKMGKDEDGWRRVELEWMDAEKWSR